MICEVSMHTTGILEVSLTEHEIERIVESDCDALVVYQIGENYFKKANFGELKKVKMEYAVYYPYDREIHMAIKGCFQVSTETKRSSEAKEIAGIKWGNADFGELRNADYNKTVVRCIL